MADDLKDRFAYDQIYDEERKPRTVKMYVRRLGYVERLTGKSIEEVTSEDLRVIKRKLIAGDLPLSRESVKGLIVATRVFHNWGAERELWPANGIGKVRCPRIPKTKPNPLPLDQARELMAACERPLEFRLIYPGFYVGCRIGESSVIEGPMWRADGFLRFVGEKTDEWREVPIHPDLEAVKWKILAHPPTYDSTMQRVKRRLVEKTGIEFVSHQLRDTFASRLYDAGVHDRMVKYWLGHAQDVTGLYVELSHRRQLEDMSKLWY